MYVYRLTIIIITTSNQIKRMFHVGNVCIREINYFSEVCIFGGKVEGKKSIRYKTSK